MNKSEVMYSYSQAMRQAELLEETALKMEALAEKQIADISEKLKNKWTTDSTRLYFRKLEQVKCEISENAWKLRKAADEIKSNAENIKKLLNE